MDEVTMDHDDLAEALREVERIEAELADTRARVKSLRADLEGAMHHFRSVAGDVARGQLPLPFGGAAVPARGRRAK